MYQVGDSVSYGTTGVCRIMAQENRTLGDAVHSCYILKPIYDSSLTICVPSDNDFLLAKMRPVMSKAEVLDLIRTMPEESKEYESDLSARREFYAHALKSGDKHDLVRMIRSIHQCRTERMANGKHLSSFDESAMREAEKTLYTEFALVLDIRPDQVVPFIMQEIDPQDEAAQSQSKKICGA